MPGTLEERRRELLRSLPSVSRLLAVPEIASFEPQLGHAYVAAVVQQATDAARNALLGATDWPGLAHASAASTPEALVHWVTGRLASAAAPSLRRVVNATGIVLHTNLGRSPLAQAAIDAVERIAAGYSNLEFDLGSGQRGSRYEHVASLLCELTGAEAAMAVNNNAAAVLLALSSLAAGKEAVVSRGQLVEIGGSFRIPDIMAQSGVRLVEVGTTNKTHLRDYEAAIGPETALLLHVHTSNFRIIGFSETVPLKELVQLGRRHNLPVMTDLGSGFLLDLRQHHITDEPTVQQTVAAGAEVVTFSGDKLLGGPQAGIIVGTRATIERLARHPLNRAVRIDKMTLAALEATLRLYRNPDLARSEIPTLRMLTLAPEDLRRRAADLAQRLRQAVGQIPPDPAARADAESEPGWAPEAPVLSVEVRPGTSQVGGGALPAQDLPTQLVVLSPRNTSAVALENWLRNWHVPVIARVQDDQVLLDVRTLLPGDDAVIAEALQALARKAYDGPAPEADN